MALFQKLLKGSTVTLAEHGIKMGLMFVVTPLMIKHLGDKDYGVWLLALTVVSYLRLLDLGISFSGTRFLGRAIGAGDTDDYRAQMETLVWVFHRIGWIALAVTGLASLIPGHFAEHPDTVSQLRWLILGFGLSTAVKFWTAIYGVILKSHVRFDLIGLASLVKSLLQGGAVISLLLAGHGLLTLLLAFLLIDVVDQILLIAFARRVSGDDGATAPWRGRRSAPLAPLIRYSATAMATNAGHSLRNGIDPLIIARFSSVAAVPVYSVGARFLTVFTDIINALFGGSFLAAFSQLHGRDDPESLIRNFLVSIRLSAAIATLGGCAMMFYGPDFIERWVGPGFSDSSRVLLILAPPTVLALMQYPIWGFFYSQNKQGMLAGLTLLGGLFNLVLSLLLARQIGFFGVVWATLTEMLIAYGLFVPAMVSRACRVPLARYLATLASSFLKVAIPSGAYFFLAHPLLKPDYTVLGLAGAGHLLIIAPLFWRFIFTGDERRALLQSLPLFRKP